MIILFVDDMRIGDTPNYWDTIKINVPNPERIASNGTVIIDAYRIPLLYIKYQY
jgi:hypothetical protein